ncbi:MAG: hypothetical protein AB7S38_42060 [Vulcanimicrobiota bacterium]
MSFLETVRQLIRTLRAQKKLLDSADRLESALEADEVELPWLLAPPDLDANERRLLGLRLELMRVCHEAKTAGFDGLLALALQARARYPFVDEVVEIRLTQGPDDRSRRLGIRELPRFSKN